MEFQKLKRRELQWLCKLNNIPANLTNAAMSHSLSLLPSVEGLEEFMRDPTASHPGSPETSVITSPDPAPASTRTKVTKQDSTLATRTRCGTRRSVQGTDTTKTPATRKNASQEASAQKWMDKDLQAAFESDMEQSQVSDNSGLLEDVSGGEQLSLESQNDTNDLNHVQEAFDALSVDQLEPTEVLNNIQKVDFRTLSRRDLQSLCKKNKIPANTTNATMADALDSLQSVEGHDEFLKECCSQSPPSPTMSEMTSSCAPRTWTSRRITKEPTNSKLITKSCRGSRRKVVVEDVDQEATVVSETLQAGTLVCKIECVPEREVQTYHRSRSKNRAVIQSAEVECPTEINFDGSRLSVAEGKNDLQSQLKSAEMEEPEVPITEDVKQLEHSENKKDSDNVYPISIGGSVVPKQPQNTVLKMDENVHSVPSAGRLQDTEVFSDDKGFSGESEDSQLEHGNESMMAEGSAGTQVSWDAGSENVSENRELDERTEVEGLDCEAYSGECEPINLCLVKKLEGAAEDDLESEKFDLDLTAYHSVLGKSADTGLEICPQVQLVTIDSDFASKQIANNHEEEKRPTRNCGAALISHSIEKVEANYTENETDSEPNIQTDMCVGEGKKTPLNNKSIRELKRMLREKLQATTLAKKMGNLTLEENGDIVAKVQEEYEDPEGNSDGLHSGDYGAPISAVISGHTGKHVRDEDLEDLKESIDGSLDVADMGGRLEDSRAILGVDAPQLHPVNKLLDSLITEDSVTGHINIEMIGEQHLSTTPSKMTKTPMSIGRMHNVSDVNKENIDTSASRTESAKRTPAVLFGHEHGKAKESN